MIEAGIVSVAILVATWWACRAFTIQAKCASTARTADSERLADRITKEAEASRNNLTFAVKKLTEAVVDQQHAELIAQLAANLTAHMATLNSRMDTMDKEWFDLSTRVQSGAAHRVVRVP